MSAVRFASPEWLALLVLLPLLIYWYVVQSPRQQGSVRFSTLAVLRQLRPGWSIRLRHLLIVLKVAGLGCLILAMARPQSGRQVRELSAEGIDIMLALDVSSSMELNDMAEGQKSRLQAAKQVIGQFIEGRVSDRIGLVVFAGESFTQFPLSLDYSLLRESLDAIEIADETWDGTAIGMGLVSACNRLRQTDGRSQVVLLLTDGVNNAGEIDPLTAAEAAAALGIRVYTIGFGSDGPVRVPVRGLFGTRYQTVQAEIDEELLERVAALTGGRYFRALSEQQLEEIYQEIGRLETTQFRSRVPLEYSERFAHFLWPGLGLLLIEVLLANTRFRRIP